jgi:glycosyltransferase involved in cell wall biosynthesis
MAPTPRVSVLIPTYNYGRYLPEAIESVLAQEFGDFELILSDDASTDGSADIVHRYAGRDARIRACVQPANLGMVAHWNWCLRQARGEYLKFLFGDDRLAGPAALGRWVRLLDEQPSAVLAVGARRIIDEDSRPTDVWDHLAENGLYDGRHVVRQCLFATHNFLGEPTATLIRTRAASRGFDPRYRQMVDLEMWCHLLLAGDLVHTDEVLCEFRRHPEQQTVLNRRQPMAGREYAWLVRDYFPRCVPAGYRLSATERWHLVLSLIHNRTAWREIPEMAPVRRSLVALVGRGAYARLWAQYRVARPFGNLRRTWRKYVRREKTESQRPVFGVRMRKS